MMLDPEDKYFSDLEKRMDGLQNDLQSIEDQVQKGPEEARLKFEHLKRSVDRKRTDIRRRLERARQDRGQAGPDLRSGLERALDELRDATNEAREQIGATDRDFRARK
jgi:hypothetical protein